MYLEVTPENVDFINYVDNLLKRKGFVQYNDGWRRDFVFITVQEGVIYIGHKIEHNIRLPLHELEDFSYLDVAINYFNNI